MGVVQSSLIRTMCSAAKSSNAVSIVLVICVMCGWCAMTQSLFCLGSHHTCEGVRVGCEG